MPRLKPVCPFCREQFTSDDVRLIRIDFSASGYATPRRRGGTHEALDTSLHQAPRFPIVESGFSRTRAEARRLEDKVAAVAAKKCSVEEVSTLHQELQEWLTHDEKQQVDHVRPLCPIVDFFFMTHITGFFSYFECCAAQSYPCESLRSFRSNKNGQIRRDHSQREAGRHGTNRDKVGS